MIALSILNVNDNKKILSINDTNVEYVHLDIMDGIFVPNKTLPFEEDVNRLEGLNKDLDIHLMVCDVKKYVDKYSTLNPEYITFHLEIEEDILLIIDYIRSKNCKVGISIKPNTDVLKLEKYLPYIDLVLVMSVEPGKGGQEFIMNATTKIEKLKQLREENGYDYVIEVDGGINDKTINLANAEISVVGSFITNSEDYQKQIEKLL